MSNQLRKSASFRSRIPVRRTKLIQKRFCSPPSSLLPTTALQTSELSSETLLHLTSETLLLPPLLSSSSLSNKHIHKKHTTKSSNNKYTKRSHRNRNQVQNNYHHNSLDSRKRYSSSSYSSSDESHASTGTPHGHLIQRIENIDRQQQQPNSNTSNNNAIVNKQQQYLTQPYQNDCNTSTDAISLDGLLDSVSSGGTFSRSVTPEKYQNMKMHKLQPNSSYDSLQYQNSMPESTFESYVNRNIRTNLVQNTERNSKKKMFSHQLLKDSSAIMSSSPQSSLRHFEIVQLQKQRQRQQVAHHNHHNTYNKDEGFSNFSTNYYSDEDNDKILSYNNSVMKSENCGTSYSSSNIDLLDLMHSPLHNQRRHQSNQRQRVVRRGNMNNCSPLQQQQQRHHNQPHQQKRHQRNFENIIKKERKIQESENVINLKCPSRISTTMTPILQKPAVPLRSPTTVISTTSQYYYHKIPVDKDKCNSVNDFNLNNNDGNASDDDFSTRIITRGITSRRDDNLDFDKFKSKHMISSTSRKLENILPSCNNHQYNTSVKAARVQSSIQNTSNHNNNLINLLATIQHNDDENGNDVDDIGDDRNDSTTSVIRYNSELKSFQAESNFINTHKSHEQKILNMQKYSRIEENSDENSFVEENCKKNGNCRIQSEKVAIRNFSYLDKKQLQNENDNGIVQITPKRNQLKPSLSDNNCSLQKVKSLRYQNSLSEISSSSFEHIKLGNSRCASIQNDIVSQKSPQLSLGRNETINLTIQGQNENSQKLPNIHDLMIFPPGKKTESYRSECELSGSYVSLECPSPPGPPACLPESRRDPQARLNNYLKTLYNDLALKEPIIPPWAIPVAPGALCPARLEPEIRIHSQSHGFNDCLTVDQLLTSIHTKEGTFLEAPRRVLIECPSWTSRCNLSLRILHAWAKEPPWPPKGTPVALALFIPLNEIKRSLANYVEKELLPKGPLNPFANGFGGFSSAWNSLESLGPKLLILLDGYDTHRGTPKRKGKHYPADIHDLLDGKIFPHARVIITTSTTNYSELLPIIQRHVTYEGLTWGRSASLLGGGQWGAPTRLLDTVQECQHLRKIVRTPLGCLSVAAIFEATAGDLPTDELDVIESILNCVAPDTTQTSIAELGRLALFAIKMKRSSITMSEIRMYCSTPDSSIMGCLDKELLLGKSARKKGDTFYNPICSGMIEFLAANYIASLVNRPGLLAAEITGLSMGDELEPELLKVIKFAMGLLGTRAHILLSKLTPLWLTPQTIFSLALAGGSSEENLSALCDMLGISKHPPISPLETKPIWVQIRSVPNELMGWGMALKSPSCTLKNLEVIYQIEKHLLLDSRKAMEIFLDSLDCNESVSTLRISSLIENDVKDAEINYLANCISKALLKPRLENFELALTLLEEDPPILKLQSVVTALCRSIPRQPKLSSLVLDLGLNTSQLLQLCSTLEKSPNVTRLSLPHLRCERGAVGALASLLTIRPLSFLALPSCWGARDDPPSSSGVSMGSGSGSSTGTSGLVKQGSLTGVPSPRSYPPGIFSSLPRGVFVPTATMGRSATLPRQPMETMADKRSSDSVISKTWYPTPACDGGPHNSGTLHDLLLAVREPFSKLHGLDLSKAQLSLEDSMCLGETVRLSNTLHTLKLEGSSRLSEILPSVLGASESPSLQMLSIGSPRLNLEDPVISISARSLTSCSTLRLLSLDGWSFRVENPSTLSILRAFLSLTSIRELSLSNCRLQIGIFRSDTKIINAFESRSVVVLKLAGGQVILADSVILRGPQLLRFIGGFPCLRELDLSAPARSGFGTSVSSPLIIDDKCLTNFFQSLHTYFSLLNTLKMCNWVIHLEDPSKTLKYLSKCIRNSPLSHLKLDGISVLDRQKRLRIESQLFHCFISSLPMLRWMGISLSGKKDEQISSIGNAVVDLKGYEIDIKLSESTIDQAKLMAQAISLDGKFDIKVSTFGTSSGILIHAEKSGARSINRKYKD